MPKKEYEFWTTNRKIPEGFIDSRNDPFIKTMLDVKSEFEQNHNDEFNDLESINDLLIEMFNIRWSKMNPTLLWQIWNIILAKSKPLDIRLDSNAVWPSINLNVSKAAQELMKNSWFPEMMVEWQWWFFKKIFFWDFFALMSANEKTWLPEFKEWTIRNIAFDSFWNKLLTKSWKKISQCIITMEYSWDRAISTFPWLEKVATAWRLPVWWSQNYNDDLDHKIEEQSSQERRLVEVAFCFDISDEDLPRYSIIAWPWASEYQKLEWKDYEYSFWKFWKDDFEPFIPVAHWKMMPYWQWVFNKWIWHLFYKQAKILASTRTKFIKVTNKNAEPTVIINTPYKSGNASAADIINADKARAQWKPPVIFNEIKTWLTGWGYSVNTLKSDPVSWEYQAILQDIKQEVANFWINIDIFATAASKTATAITIEEQNLSEAIRQFHEVNAKTYEMIFRYSLEIFRKNISKNDKTPFAFVPVDAIEWIETPIEWEIMTYWDLKELLDTYKFNIIVDSRTWVYPNPVFEERLKTRFVNTLLSIWEVEPAKKLIEWSAQAFWINLKLWAKKEEAAEWTPAPIPDLLQW